ncbi:MAG: peptidase M13, partial [Pirellulaceae bacterium]
MRDSIRDGLGGTDASGPLRKRSAHRRRRAAVAMLVAIFASPSVAQEAPQNVASGIEQQYRSRQTKPGDDFYRYMNDGWLENTKIPEDQSNYGSFSVLDDANKALIRKLIEEAAGNPSATGPAAQVGSLYRSYVDLEGRNQKGLQPIAELIRKVRAIESKSQWAELAGALSRVGIGGFFGMGVEPDARKSDQYAVYMGQSGTTLPDRDYYLKEEGRYAEARAALQKYAETMFQSAGHPEPAKAAEHVIDLETRFAKAQWEKVLLRDPVKNYNKMPVDQVKQLLSKFD